MECSTEGFVNFVDLHVFLYLCWRVQQSADKLTHQEFTTTRDVTKFQEM